MTKIRLKQGKQHGSQGSLTASFLGRGEGSSASRILLAAADMGVVPAGGNPSRIAIRAIQQSLSSQDTLKIRLRESLVYANEQLYQRSAGAWGASVITAVITNETLRLAYFGAVAAFLRRKGEVYVLTPTQGGQDYLGRANYRPIQTYIAASIAQQNEVTLQPGDEIILCSGDVAIQTQENPQRISQYAGTWGNVAQKLANQNGSTYGNVLWARWKTKFNWVAVWSSIIIVIVAVALAKVFPPPGSPPTASPPSTITTTLTTETPSFTSSPSETSTPTNDDSELETSTPTPTRRSSPTAINTPTPQPPTATIAPVETTSQLQVTPQLDATMTALHFVLNSPDENITVEGRVRFTWSTNVVLGDGQAFEWILWKPGEDPLTQGLGWGGSSDITQVEVDFDDLALANGEYFWGVRVIQLVPYEKIFYLGESRKLIVNRVVSENERPIEVPITTPTACEANPGLIGCEN